MPQFSSGNGAADFYFRSQPSAANYPQPDSTVYLPHVILASACLLLPLNLAPVHHPCCCCCCFHHHATIDSTSYLLACRSPAAAATRTDAAPPRRRRRSCGLSFRAAHPHLARACITAQDAEPEHFYDNAEPDDDFDDADCPAPHDILRSPRVPRAGECGNKPPTWGTCGRNPRSALPASRPYENPLGRAALNPAANPGSWRRRRWRRRWRRWWRW